MALKIIWSEFAETQLDEIYDYYEKKVSTKVAKKLVRGIIDLCHLHHLTCCPSNLKQCLNYRMLKCFNDRMI